MKILVVCTGNTCRSPLAEGLLKERAREENMGDLEVISAGTAAPFGLSATQNAVRAAAELGIDISSHRSKPLTPEVVREADLVLAMEYTHVEYADRIGGHGKTFLISQFPHGEGTEVRDPIGGSLQDYRAACARLDREVRRIVAYLRAARQGEKGSDEVTRGE